MRKLVSTKDTTIAKVKSELNATKTWAESLEDELKKDKSNIEWLQLQRAKLEEEKSLVENKLGQLKSTYDGLISELEKQIENQEVTIKAIQEKISVTFVDRILFKSGRATITTEGKNVLKKVGDKLMNVRDRTIRVIGHTDNVPMRRVYRYKFPTNWELSAARAATVVRYFQHEIGLDPKDMEAVGQSFYDPIASNDTEEGRALNRRVNIIIAPKFE